MKRLIYTIVFFTILLLAMAPQPVSATARPDTTGKVTGLRVMPLHTDRGMNSYAYNAFTNAILLEQMGDYWGAAENYKIALSYYPDSYELGYSLAEIYYRMRDPQKALEQLSTLDPKESSFYRLQAACFQALGDAEGARKAFLNLVQYEPDNEQAFAFLATAFRSHQDLDSTIWAYRNLARLQPDNYRIFNEIGKLEAQLGHLDTAKQAFLQSLDISSLSENITAFGGLGELYMMMKQVDSAEATFKQGIAVDSNNILLQRQLVALYVDKDSFNLALPHARKVVELSPLDRPSVRRLALLYFQVDSLNQADSIFTDLIRGGEHVPINHYYLGHIALRKKDFARAQSEFQMVANVEDTVAESWLDLGFVYNQMKQPEQELDVYQEAIKHVHDSAGIDRIDLARGSALERGGRWDDAVAVFEKLIARNPGYHQALNYLGYMFADKNVRLDEARSLLERALTMAPDNAAYLDSYGWVYYRLGLYDKALELLHKAAALVADATIFEHLGDTYKAAGKDDLARSWWLKASELNPENIALKEKLEK